MSFKMLLDGYTDIQEMDGYQSHAGRRDSFNLASSSAEILWAEGPVPVLHCSVFFVNQ